MHRLVKVTRRQKTFIGASSDLSFPVWYVHEWENGNWEERGMFFDKQRAEAKCHLIMLRLHIVRELKLALLPTIIFLNDICLRVQRKWDELTREEASSMTLDTSKKEWHEKHGSESPHKTIYVDEEKAAQLKAVLAGEDNFVNVEENLPPEYINRAATFIMQPAVLLDDTGLCKMGTGVALHRKHGDKVHIWCRYETPLHDVHDTFMPSGDLTHIGAAPSFIPHLVGILTIRGVAHTRVCPDKVTVTWVVGRACDE